MINREITWLVHPVYNVMIKLSSRTPTWVVSVCDWRSRRRRLESRWQHFKTWASSFTPHCQCLLKETLYWYGQLVGHQPLAVYLCVCMCVCVCPWTFRDFGRRMMNLPSSNPRKALSSQFMMNGWLWNFDVCRLHMWDGAIHYKLYLLKLTMAVDNFVFRIIEGAF